MNVFAKLNVRERDIGNLTLLIVIVLFQRVLVITIYQQQLELSKFVIDNARQSASDK